MPPQAWIALALFVPLLLVGCLHLLAASGHFPAEHRSEPFKSGSGRALLLGSMAIVVACVGAGLVLVWRAAPWYFVVIGGGLAILAAPLALRPLPDSFVVVAQRWSCLPAPPRRSRSSWGGWSPGRRRFLSLEHFGKSLPRT